MLYFHNFIGGGMVNSRFFSRLCPKMESSASVAGGSVLSLDTSDSLWRMNLDVHGETRGKLQCDSIIFDP